MVEPRHLLIIVPINQQINIIKRTPTTNEAGIQRGLVTHHQDHVAIMPISANFNTKKIRNTNPHNPIPVLVLEFLLILFVI